MHSAKGVYALLLGSGLSRAAQIPTGWEITLEMVRKAGVTEGKGVDELLGVAAEQWYRQEHGKIPDYAEFYKRIQARDR